MRNSFVLGLVGGIVTFVVGVLIIFLGAFLTAFGGEAEGIEYLLALNFVGGTMGIVGGAMGKKMGGTIMIIAGVLALIGASVFGILGLVLLVVGGVLALKEKPSPAQPSGNIADS